MPRPASAEIVDSDDYIKLRTIGDIRDRRVKHGAVKGGFVLFGYFYTNDERGCYRVPVDDTKIAT